MSPVPSVSTFATAFCAAMNWPLSQFALKPRIVSTTPAWPATQATRHPAIEKVFVIEWTATPTSFAPGTSRKEAGASS
jgi:hypothetical protein